MKITVVITTWQVPFDQVVRAVRKFDDPETAKAFINKESKKWWEDSEGDRLVAEFADDRLHKTEPYEEITELGYDHARYELCGGEAGFHAMLDAKSYAALQEAYYKREWDDKGITRPGYLINAYVAQGPDSELVGGKAKHEEYVRQQTAGMKAIEERYVKKSQH